MPLLEASSCLAPSEADFERKLEVRSFRFCGITFFTESLILAQDERWRRA